MNAFFPLSLSHTFTDNSRDTIRRHYNDATLQC